MLRARTGHLINTGALARCNDALRSQELFQQFVKRSGKPLKRLGPRSTWLHRAKAPVVMRLCRFAREMPRLAPVLLRFFGKASMQRADELISLRDGLVHLLDQVRDFGLNAGRFPF